VDNFNLVEIILLWQIYFGLQFMASGEKKISRTKIISTDMGFSHNPHF